MRKLIAAATIAVGLTMLAGCSDKEGGNTPNEQENAELNNISEMLDASPDSMVANEDAPLGNGEVDVVEDGGAAGNEGDGNSAISNRQ